MAFRSKDPAVRALIARADHIVDANKKVTPAHTPGKIPTVARAKARPPHTPGELNKGEARYRDHLEMLVLAGEVRLFWFEAIRFRLAERFNFTPDFFVILPDWTIEFREVKGRKGETFYAKEDAVKSIKAAAALYPFFRFFIVWPAPGGGAWREKEIKP